MLNVISGTGTETKRKKAKTPAYSEHYRIGQVVTMLTYHKHGVTTTDIAREIGVTDRQVRNLLQKLIARQLVRFEVVKHRRHMEKYVIYPVGGQS